MTADEDEEDEIDFSRIVGSQFAPIGRLDIADAPGGGRTRAATMAAGSGRPPTSAKAWGAGIGGFPPPPTPRAPPPTTMPTTAPQGRLNRGMSAHAFAPWTSSVFGRRGSSSSSSSNPSAYESAVLPAASANSSSTSHRRRPPAHRPRPGSGRDSEEEGEADSSSDEELQGTAEATTSWVRRRSAAMRAATVGNLARCSFSRSGSTDGSSSANPSASFGAAGPPGLVVKGTIVAGRAGRARAATMAAQDAADTICSASARAGAVRARAQQYEERDRAATSEAILLHVDGSGTRSVQAATVIGLGDSGDTTQGIRLQSTPL